MANQFHNQGKVRPTPQDNPATESGHKRGKVNVNSASFQEPDKPGNNIKMPKNIGGDIQDKGEALDIIDPD